VAVRGGQVNGVIMHTDQGSEYSADLFRAACTRLGVRQSMGRAGSALDNAAIESWHSTLEFELRSVQPFATKARPGGRCPPGSTSTTGTASTQPCAAPTAACSARSTTNSPTPPVRRLEPGRRQLRHDRPEARCAGPDPHTASPSLAACGVPRSVRGRLSRLKGRCAIGSADAVGRP
jgi:hypothetical protein